MRKWGSGRDMIVHERSRWGRMHRHPTSLGRMWGKARISREGLLDLGEAQSGNSRIILESSSRRRAEERMSRRSRIRRKRMKLCFGAGEGLDFTVFTLRGVDISASGQKAPLPAFFCQPHPPQYRTCCPVHTLTYSCL